MARETRTRRVQGTALTLIAEAWMEIHLVRHEIFDWDRRTSPRAREESLAAGEGWPTPIYYDIDCFFDELKAVELPNPPPIPESIAIWKMLSGTITDFRPRAGRTLARWKRVEMSWQMIEIAVDGVGGMLGEIDGAENSDLYDSLIDYEERLQHVVGQLQDIIVPNGRR